jgi:hypothetical protein
MADEIEIDATALVDGLFRDCLGANLPPLPAVLAEVLGRIFTRGGSSSEYAVCFAQLLILIRERLEYLNATMKAPN